MQQPSDQTTIRVGDRPAATALVAQVMANLQALEAVLDAETALVRKGQLREGLKETAAKSALLGAYLQGLETAKANAIALARFAPDAIEGLKAAHRRFAVVVETNQQVLATARSVAENLVKTLAEDMSRSRVATVYGVASTAPSHYGRAGAARSQPLLLSRKL